MEYFLINSTIILLHYARTYVNDIQKKKEEKNLEVNDGWGKKILLVCDLSSLINWNSVSQVLG